MVKYGVKPYHSLRISLEVDPPGSLEKTFFHPEIPYADNERAVHKRTVFEPVPIQHKMFVFENEVFYEG